VLFFVTVIIVIHGRPCFLTDAQEDDAFSYPGGLVLVESSGENSVVVGPHIRGSRLRSSAAGFGEVDLLLPGAAR
jgi:1-phosphatidylinositol-4-phosphate 5-kinase